MMKVSVWLEDLHDRRVEVTRSYDHILQKLSRKMKSLDAALLIDKYTSMIHNIKDAINNVNHVGQNIDECGKQISHLQNCERGLMEVTEKCLKLVSTCESDNSIYGDVSLECNMHAYDSLQMCTELQQVIEQKIDVITQSITILQEYAVCIHKLEALENEISNGKSISSMEVSDIISTFTQQANYVLEKSSHHLNNSTVR